MESLAIVSLIGNTMQFLDFGTKLVSKSAQLYHSNKDALAEVADAEGATLHLQFLNNEMKAAATQTGDNTLAEICKSCGTVADELLTALEKVKVKSKDKHSRRESIAVALRTIWSKEELSQLEKRLFMFREQLNLHVTLHLRFEPQRKVEDYSDSFAVNKSNSSK